MTPPPGDSTSMAVQCRRCGRDFVWRARRPITPNALLHRPLYCPECRKLVSQHRIDI